MSKEKLSSQEIIDIVATKASVSKRASEEFLKVMISTIEEALLAGDTVKIKNFGTFKLHWNEPRKSVNVQTGETIILSGYYKVNFTPDANLRDLVNEPFGHLEAVQLEGETIEQPVQKEVEPIDPLRTLNEQASEIKDILAEIMNFQPNRQKSEIKDETEVALPEEVLENNEDEIPHQEHEKTIQISDNKIDEVFINVKEEPIVEEVQLIEAVIDNEVEAEIPETIESDFEPEIKDEETFSPVFVPKKKKSKVWIWILVGILIVAGVSSVGLYYLYPPAKDKITVFKKAFFKNTREQLLNFSDWLNSKPQKKEIPVTIVIPKDTTAVDSISEEEEVLPVDSLQVLFDNPRNYSEIIATETIHSGSRLTVMAKKYYGLKDFWVYIYEANREKINDPDKIPSGTIIYIPKLDSRLIDKNNQRCIDKAKELRDLYVKKVLKND